MIFSNHAPSDYGFFKPETGEVILSGCPAATLRQNALAYSG